MDMLLLWNAVIAERIQLVDSSQTACEPSDALEDISRLVRILEVEGNEAEIASTYTDGRWVRGTWQPWPEDAACDDVIGYPEFARFLGCGLVMWKMYLFARVYQMMASEMKGACELLCAVAERMDIVNLQIDR
jgi:hypothetical protein